MNLGVFPRHRLPIESFLATMIIGALASTILAADVPATMQRPTNGEFSAIGSAVVALLQTRDAANFASNTFASSEDWHSLITTNMSHKEREAMDFFAKRAGIQRLESNGKAVLSMADSLHLRFNQEPRFQIVPPKFVGRVYFFGDDERFSEPYVQKLDVILIPGGHATGATNADFKLAVRGLQKFPGGWRIVDGVQWESFPSTIADTKALRKITILDKVADRKGITGQDDPALLQLGKSLARFIRSQNVAVYQRETLMNSDWLWTVTEQGGLRHPSREEFDRETDAQVQKQIGVGRTILQQMDRAGIDLSKAQIRIKSASVERCQPQGAPGSLNGLIGERFKLTLAVQSDHQSKTGVSLSGNYILGADEIIRSDNGWRIMGGLRWDQFPPGVVRAATEEKLKFENYIAEYGTLPPGTMAPDIDFITLASGRKMKLSDFRGKIVVLDFWATWCFPCQQPMADLQKIRNDHPNWDDKVAIVPLSIDDTIGKVRKYVEVRGWTNTFNVWAGEGGWNSAPAKKFRVTGIPTAYIIDGQGKIIMGGQPMSLPIGKTVDGLLKQ